jgi:lycopene cyclase domain-containing protein
VTYTAAALLGMAGSLTVDLAVLRTRLVTRAVFWATYPIVFVFQLISNGILTGRHIVIYDPDAIVGWRLIHAPVEDLLFGFAMVLLTLSIWVWLGRRGVQRTPAAGEGSALLRRAASLSRGDGSRRRPGPAAPTSPRSPRRPRRGWRAPPR